MKKSQSTLAILAAGLAAASLLTCGSTALAARPAPATTAAARATPVPPTQFRSSTTGTQTTFSATVAPGAGFAVRQSNKPVCSQAASTPGTARSCTVDLTKTFTAGQRLRFEAVTAFPGGPNSLAAGTIVTIPYGPVRADATLDKPSRTAHLVGLSRPGATIEVDGADRDVTAAADGSWVADVPGMKVAANTIAFREFVGGAQTSAGSVSVPFTIASLVATGSFGPEITDDATISGTAEPDAEIRITDSDDRVTTTTASPDGAWSTGVPAPGPGLQLFAVTQTTYGIESGAESVPLDYGPPVTITSPHDGDSFDGSGQP